MNHNSEAWQDPSVKKRIEFHLEFLKTNPSEKFLISQSGKWLLTFVRDHKNQDVIAIYLSALEDIAYV